MGPSEIPKDQMMNLKDLEKQSTIGKNEGDKENISNNI